ncbi:ABC transporter substrate-binding protein [Kitasatospora aureofaciens]|uniref:ABC transporter substrate-binding protein n=1 Tax=Kitasatospora aureofaciens TaxID=1894 RepID=A0A1E7N1J1_KITAU|nr:ABC transporter substrate-binding protein [Kitasatospora aureofaciens]ARF78719.1 ABC transporter substrate-binding protein [Kitasatospora aureofaciens]OEV34333.1 ABC transporter substrate-binding protein [Kitasatospora aureofaciens]GGU78002.1 putative amino acid ABC transporter, substrate-binding protein [Kitasatospora aureofaciens]
MSLPRRALVTAVGALAAALVLAGCGSGATGASADLAPAKGSTAPNGTVVNLSPQQNRVTTPKVDAIAALVPEEIRKRGTLKVVDSIGTTPPLDFYADDDKTIIGVEPDIASLIGNVLGLKVEFNPVSWENIFVGLDSGKYDAGLSNITVTEERKEKYDFATYRLDVLGFEAKKGSGIKVTGPKDLAGRSVGVATGTNQEKLLIAWSEEDVRNGLKPIDIKYFSGTEYYLALSSGRIDVYTGPNPSLAFHAVQTGETEVVGTYSGGGADVLGKIAATTHKDNGLVKALNEALNEVIRNGTYGQVLKRWGLETEAVQTSEINPVGLPKPKP